MEKEDICAEHTLSCSPSIHCNFLFDPHNPYLTSLRYVSRRAPILPKTFDGTRKDSFRVWKPT